MIDQRKEDSAIIRLNLSSIAQAIVVGLLLAGTGWWGSITATQANTINEQGKTLIIVVERQNNLLKRVDADENRISTIDARLNFIEATKK